MATEISFFTHPHERILLINNQRYAVLDDHKRFIDVITLIAEADSKGISVEDIAHKLRKDKKNYQLPSEGAVLQWLDKLKNLGLIMRKKTGRFILQDNIIIKNYLHESIQSTLKIENIKNPEELLIASDQLLMLGKISSAIILLKSLKLEKLTSNINSHILGRIADLYSIQGEYETSNQYCNIALEAIGTHGKNILRSFLHEIAARSYYYMGGKKNIYKALHHINEGLDCWNTRTLKHDARRAEQFALQARIISAIPDQNHNIITRHFDATYSVIKNENCNNEHEYAYLFNLTDYNKLCYYLSCIQQDKLRPLFEDKCGQLISYMCDNDQYRYTPSEWFDLKEAECIFKYHTMKNDQKAIAISAAEALDFAARANIHVPRIQNIRTIFRKSEGKIEDIEFAKQRNNKLMNTAKLFHYLSCPMCRAFTGNVRN